jgi:hypothetical protein
MWIFTQDGSKVININHFFVSETSKIINSCEASYSIFGLESNGVIAIELGRYYKEESALLELEEICNALKNNINFYSLPTRM